MKPGWEAWAGRIAFGLLAVVVGLGYAALIRGQLTYGLEYDESYLLRVIDNIAAGRGFVDDGVAYFTTGEAFHPFISTGPMLLLPSALVWSITDGSLAITRLVPISFFVLYLIATAILFYRWRGRWAAIAALSGPLLLPILMPDLTNRSVMPGRFVGETAATALLVIMAVLLARRHLVWAGLAGGLAVQTKLNFALPVLVVIAVWFVGSWLAHRGPALRSLLRLLPGLLLPTVLFEAYKLVTLGLSGYAHNIELTRAFTAFNTVALADLPDATLAKMASLPQLLSGPAVVVVAMATGLLVLALLLEPYLRRQDPRFTPSAVDDVVALVAAVAGVLSFLVWWLLTSSQSSPRPAVPGVMLTLSLLAAAMVVAAISTATRAEGRLRWPAALLPTVAIAVLVLSVAYQGVRIARNTTGTDLLNRQEQAAAVIVENSNVLPIDDFWTNPEFGVLTDLPYQTGSRLNPSLLVYTSVRALIERGQPDAQLYMDNCGEVLYATKDVVVCRPSPTTSN